MKSNKTVMTLSACALAGLVAFSMRRAVTRWRKLHLDFDFPPEQALFV